MPPRTGRLTPKATPSAAPEQDPLPSAGGSSLEPVSRVLVPTLAPLPAPAAHTVFLRQNFTGRTHPVWNLNSQNRAPANHCSGTGTNTDLGGTCARAGTAGCVRGTPQCPGQELRGRRFSASFSGLRGEEGQVPGSLRSLPADPSALLESPWNSGLQCGVPCSCSSDKKCLPMSPFRSSQEETQHLTLRTTEARLVPASPRPHLQLDRKH